VVDLCWWAVPDQSGRHPALRRWFAGIQARHHLHLRYLWCVGETGWCIAANLTLRWCTGLNGSRTRPISDYLADQGYLVILPDIFEGTQFEEHGGFAAPGKFSEEARVDCCFFRGGVTRLGACRGS
jgi:hypothetical protein